MGTFDVTSYRDEAQLRLFTQHLLRDLEALEYMLRNGLVESDKRRGGAEQEMFLVDAARRPANLATQLLELLDDDHFVHELALFNLECNLDPFELGGDCLRRLERQVGELVGRARRGARDLGGDVVLCGILPTLRMEDAVLENMTPKPRYYALNEALKRLRGGEFRLHIKGIDEVKLIHDTVMLEACNTSFQVHFQVEPDDFARMYNIAQLVSAPVMALAVNSPLLFGKRLWRETRLALFQQSVDTRRDEMHEREFLPRVSFGSAWVREGVLELYREDVSRYPALVGSEEYEDPFEAIEAGRPPTLQALRLHTGTVYRWNRACYGVGEDEHGVPHAHLRIENRLLPAGPSVVDEVANAALWFGLLHGLDRSGCRPSQAMEFEVAKDNLLSAARIGLDAQLHWLDGRHHPADRLIAEELLPIAEDGLEALEVDRDDRLRYLDVLRGRLKNGHTGARWQLNSYSILRKEVSQTEALDALVASTIRHQEEGDPVHEWPWARPCAEDETFRALYETVASVMDTDLYTVRESELVDLAAKLMDWWHVRHVPVEDEQHRLVGLVTHRTLMRWAFRSRSEGHDRPVPVSEIMERDLVTITPDTRTLDAIRLMRDKGIGCLPVVNGNGRLVGLVSEESLVRIAGKLLEEKLRD